MSGGFRPPALRYLILLVLAAIALSGCSLLRGPQEAPITEAVQLPAAEAPTIVYQDPLDQLRAFLGADGLFYTMLDAEYPAQRTLIQFFSGENVSYERVFSYLDAALKDTTMFTNSVATELNTWDTNALTMSFPSQFSAPYVVTNTVNVGDITIG